MQDESRTARVAYLILLPILLPALVLVVVLVGVVKLVTLPFEHPITRSPADVARILRALLEDTVSDEEWDGFVCIPIADKRLDEIRQRCAGLHDEFRVSSPPEDRTLLGSEAAAPAGPRIYISAAGQNVVHAYLRELEGAA